MISTPTEFQDAIFSSHKLATEAKVSVTDDPAEDVVVEPIDGQVTLDVTAAIRGNCSLTFNDPALIPIGTDSLLAPYGNEVTVSRGIEAGGFRWLVQLGVFTIQETTVSADGGVVVTGSDRAQKVSDAILEADYPIALGSDFLTVMQAIVSDSGVSLPSVDFIEKDAHTPTLTAEQGADRWTFAQDMASILGCHLYFSNTGVLTLRPMAQETDTAAIEIVEGEDGVEVKPALLDMSRTWSRREAHNKWIVISDSTDAEGAAPPQAEAVDDDPASPTYYLGRFGKKPEIWHSSMIGELAAAAGDPAVALCQEAADGKKAKESGITKEVDFGSLVNPALEPNDVVHVRRTFTHEGETIVLADEHHIIDSLTIPLGAEGTMQAQTRQVGGWQGLLA